MRINTIPPWAESDSHLMAEIREIKNVSYEEWKDYYNNFLFFAKKNTKLERIA